MHTYIYIYVYICIYLSAINPMITYRIGNKSYDYLQNHGIWSIKAMSPSGVKASDLHIYIYIYIYVYMYICISHQAFGR